jgi:hypothetical protein
MKPILIQKSSFVVLLLACFAFTGCFSDHKENGSESNVKGHIQFPEKDKIYFYSYADSIDLFTDHKSAMDSAMIDKDGNYSFPLHHKNPLVFNLVNGDKNLVTNFFITPGDHLKINFVGKDQKIEIFPSGNAARYNAYLVKFLYAFYQEPLAKQQYYIVSNYMDLSQFTSYNETRRQEQVSFFKNFFRDDSLTKEFKDYALNTINYGAAVDRLMYLWKKRMKGEHVEADSTYFNFETSSFIENQDAFSTPSYSRFLNLYIKDTYERMVEHGELPLNKSEKLIPQVEKFKLAIKLLNRPYRDAVLYTIIPGDMNDVGNMNAQHAPSNISLDSMIVWFTHKYRID